MRGLVSNYALSLKLALVLALLSGGIALTVAGRSRAEGKRPTRPASRVLAIGSALVIAVATGLPYDLPYRREGFGDLVLTPGRGGLSEWRVILERPDSLAAVLLVFNVLLYIPLAFFGVLGWKRPAVVLGACLSLSLLVEASQYFVTARTASLDDVLLNMGGAVVGAMLAGLVRLRGRAAPG